MSASNDQTLAAWNIDDVFRSEPILGAKFAVENGKLIVKTVDVGGPAWDTWNVRMRDMLMAKQDKGKTQGRPHQVGSWSPAGDAHAGAVGRLMITSLSVLTLEVYYRHLPLYRREGAGREAPAGEMKKDEPKKEEMKKDDAK